MLNARLLGERERLLVDSGNRTLVLFREPRWPRAQQGSPIAGPVSSNLIPVGRLVLKVPLALVLDVFLAPRLPCGADALDNILPGLIRSALRCASFGVVLAPELGSGFVLLLVPVIVVALRLAAARVTLFTSQAPWCPKPRSKRVTVTLEPEVVSVAVTIFSSWFFAPTYGARGGGFPPPHTFSLSPTSPTCPVGRRRRTSNARGTCTARCPC